MKKNSKKLIQEYKKSIPMEISALFGKFYFFSFLLIIFLLIFYPLIVIKKCSFISSVLLLIFLGLFYIWMIIDVLKNRKNFNSSMFYILILLFVGSYISAIFHLIKL